MKKYEEMTYEEQNAEKENIAKILWDSPFCSGVQKLNKMQLILLVMELVERLDFLINLNGDWNVDERDFKDTSFDQKCLMIESVDNDFFKEEP